MKMWAMARMASEMEILIHSQNRRPYALFDLPIGIDGRDGG